MQTRNVELTAPNNGLLERHLCFIDETGDDRQFIEIVGGNIIDVSNFGYEN